MELGILADRTQAQTDDDAALLADVAEFFTLDSRVKALPVADLYGGDPVAASTVEQTANALLDRMDVIAESMTDERVARLRALAGVDR